MWQYVAICGNDNTNLKGYLKSLWRHSVPTFLNEDFIQPMPVVPTGLLLLWITSVMIAVPWPRCWALRAAGCCSCELGCRCLDWLQMIGTWTFTNGFKSIFWKQCAWSFSGQYFFWEKCVAPPWFSHIFSCFFQLRIGPPGLLRFLYCWQLLRTHHRASSAIARGSPQQSHPKSPRSAALLGKRRRTGEWISADFLSDPKKYWTIYMFGWEKKLCRKMQKGDI